MSEPETPPLRIGLSARLMHKVPAELGFRNKTLQYLEQAAAHWVMGGPALCFMLPTLGYDAEIERRKVSVRQYVDALDGLVMQGGADVSPSSYGQEPLRLEWSGDPARDRYEMELVEGFLEQGKPIFGICRGAQLLNVFFGGSLYQDIPTQRPEARAHVDGVKYDKLCHHVDFEPDSRIKQFYGGLSGGDVTSIHHQAVDRLGSDLIVEARSSEDGIVEAIRARGECFVAGVQWHPEFHSINPALLDPDPLLQGFLAAARKAQRER
ncbi:MAG TPA: gamma-glutamyl-gamma-aminobutyrate hydrolase family protein [Burkholderiaceae bacterium]